MDENSILFKQMELNSKKIDIEEKLKIELDHVAEQLKNVEKYNIFNILKQLQAFKKNTDRSMNKWPYNCFVYNAFGYNIDDSEADELIADNRLKISQLQEVAEAYKQVSVDIKQNIDDHQDGVKVIDSVSLDKYLAEISGYKVKWLNDKWISDEAVQRVSEIQRRITLLATPASKSSESAVKSMLVADDSDVKCATKFIGLVLRQPNNGQALLGNRKLTSNLQDSPREAAQNIPKFSGFVMRQPNNGQSLLGNRKLTSNLRNSPRKLTSNLQDSPREAAQNIPKFSGFVMRQPNNGQALLANRKLTSNLRDSPREAAQDIPVVFFDLETTGLFSKNGYKPEIISIGAVDSYKRKKTYKEIYHPNIDIQRGATPVNGFCKLYDAIAGREYLFLDGERVDGMDMKEGLESFIEWLDNNYDEPVLLVAHNCFTFDAKV